MTNEEIKEQVSPQMTNEILDHMMHPRNYGNLDDLNCAGVAYDEQTNEFVSMYMKVIDEKIEDISFGTNGCTDTVVAGSIFTEMIKGDSLENAKIALDKMMKKLENAPEQLRICSTMVLLSCEACIQNHRNRLEGIEAELFKISMQESCQGVEAKGEVQND